MLFGVPWRLIVPAPVAWFWAVVERGDVPFVTWDAYGTYSADVEDAPTLLCHEDIVRLEFVYLLLRAAHEA